MAQVESMEVQDLGYQKVEEYFEDRDVEVVDTLLLNETIGEVKDNLRFLKEHGTDVHNIHQSYFHFFTTDQTPSFPKFVAWCADNYSLSERVIMDTTSSIVMCPIIPLAIRKKLSVPEDFTLKSQDYKEEYILYVSESPW